jgi:hypothetical protein
MLEAGLSCACIIALKAVGHCFWLPRALLWDAKSIALGRQEHCSQRLKALLPAPESIASGDQEHCFMDAHPYIGKRNGVIR